MARPDHLWESHPSIAGDEELCANCRTARHPEFRARDGLLYEWVRHGCPVQSERDPGCPPRAAADWEPFPGWEPFPI